MSNKVNIVKSGSLIQLSADGVQPLDPYILRKIEPQLCYNHVCFNWAQVAYGGRREQSFESETVRLFEYDSDSLLVTQKGFLPRLTEIFKAENYAISFIDYDEPKAASVYMEDWDDVVSKFDFRPQQDVCLTQIAGHDGGIIDAITAFGKMYVIAMVCCLYRNAKIDIVVSRKDVADSIQRLVTKYVPLVGRVGGGKKVKGRVTVYTVKSLNHSNYDADIVLADEVHELVTDANRLFLSRYKNARMFGFTASKETRMDNAYHHLEGMFGPTIFKIDYPTGEKLGLVVPIVVQWLDVRSNSNPCSGISNITVQKRLGIWQHAERNSVIAEAANGLHAKGQQVLILVDTVEHLLHLKKLLPEFAICCSENAEVNSNKSLHASYVQLGLLEEDEVVMTAVKRGQTREAFERRELLGVIATGVWSVGVSFNGLNVLIRADGSSSETANVQLPGRVCRTDAATAKGCGILIDCIDHWDNKYRNRSFSRRRSYSQRGWTQVNPDGSIWNEIKGKKRAKV